MEGGRRPRRSCAGRKAAAPSAVHYVGYVEDNETPEMIMKKFEELEKVRAAPAQSEGVNGDESSDAPEAGPSGREGEEVERVAGLSDDQLLQVFKQTSIFNVRSALAGNHSLMDDPGMDGTDRWSDDEDLDDDNLWSDVRGFWSDEEDGDYSDTWRKGAQSRGSRREGRAPRGPSHSRPPRHEMVTSYNTSTRALIRKKVRAADADALVQIKVPHPLPLSWGRTVKPYVPPELRGSERLAEGDENVDGNGGPPQRAHAFEQDSVLNTDWSNLRQDYLGVLINPGWEVPGGGGGGAAAVANLCRLPLPRLCPIGFVFIWLQKPDILPVVMQMRKWGFCYVENLTWVFLHRNNRIMRLPSPHFRRSHLTLFLFRKDGLGKDIELRHQRKPDVVFDTVRRSPGQAFEVPEEAYSAIETMLPSGGGKFLELWSKPGPCRPGWSQVAQKPKAGRIFNGIRVA